MKNLAINRHTGDFDFTGGQISQVEGALAIGQTVSTDLKTFLGEFWLDRSFGMPYYEIVFKKGTDLSAIKTLYIQKILDRDEVLEVTKFEMTLDTANRILRIELGTMTTEGSDSDIIVEV